MLYTNITFFFSLLLRASGGCCLLLLPLVSFIYFFIEMMLRWLIDLFIFIFFCGEECKRTIDGYNNSGLNISTSLFDIAQAASPFILFGTKIITHMHVEQIWRCFSFHRCVYMCFGSESHKHTHIYTQATIDRIEGFTCIGLIDLCPFL